MNEEERVPITLSEWYTDFALEIELSSDQSFLTVIETLERIGLESNRGKKLFQSCHILSKKNKYYIVHFKELFALDGRSVNISKEDLGRRNTIACLLDEWGLVSVKNPKYVNDNRMPVASIRVLKHAEKCDYELVAKYQIGNIRKGK